MKRKVVMLLCVIFICLCFFGCDDEFGIKIIHIEWSVFIPKDITKNVKIIRKDFIDDFDNNDSTKNEYDCYFFFLGWQIDTRRNFVDECLIEIEYKTGEKEIINAKADIPYLEEKSWSEKKFSFSSEKCGQEIEYVFSYTLSRSI